MICDHCGQELRTGMSDGRVFELVHANGGMRYCRLLPAERADEMTVATWEGKTEVPYGS